MQILFRVRDTRTGKIVDGDFAVTKEGQILQWDCVYGAYTLNGCNKFLQIEQWTGLTDRNGVKIFEGDRMRYSRRSVRSCKVVEFTGKIEWRQHTCSFEHHGTILFDDDACNMEVLNDDSV